MKRYKGEIDITIMCAMIIFFSVGVVLVIAMFFEKEVEIARIEMEKIEIIDRQTLITKSEFEHLGEIYKITKMEENKK